MIRIIEDSRSEKDRKVAEQAEIIELDAALIDAVAGGLNPQPLPPSPRRFS